LVVDWNVFFAKDSTAAANQKRNVPGIPESLLV
jgi:hypothetical protein